jgi:hypothetical protein
MINAQRQLTNWCLESEILKSLLKECNKVSLLIDFYELSRHFKNSSLPAGVEGLKALFDLAHGTASHFI